MIRAMLATAALVLSLAAPAQSDDRKAMAFDIVERNAAELATIGDTLYY